MSHASLTRRSAVLVASLTLIISAVLVPYVAHAQTNGQPNQREGEVLVKMKAGTGLAAVSVSETAVSELARKLKGVKARKLRSSHVVPGLYALSLTPGEKVEDKVVELMSNPDVEYAQPNYIYRASAVPDDPDFGQQWALFNATKPGSDMHMESAWDITTGSSSVVVGIIDSGIDYNHPDLIANLWDNTAGYPGDSYTGDKYGINAITGSGDPLDDNGHGTHVAGIIGAAGNNKMGVAGVNWNVSLMALKFLDSGGSGTTADAIECINYAVKAKQGGVNIRVLNASWGGKPGDPDDPALEDAITSASDNDILFVAAAGNSTNNNDTKHAYPASSTSPNVIAVAATDSADAMASFSNYGLNSVHVAAPGVAIISTLPTGMGSYTTLSGTSMAAPQVSGLAALILSRTPDMSVAQLKYIIMNSVDKITGLKVWSGGRVNADAALNLVSPATNPLTFKEVQDGAYTLFTAAFAVDGVPQYGRKINFYQDGVLVGSASTASASSTTTPPGTAKLKITAKLGSHKAYAVTAPSTTALFAQSDSVDYSTLAPGISSVDPAEASVGTPVTVTGTNFGSLKGTLQLLDSSTVPPTITRLRFTSWTDTTIKFNAPKKKAGSFKLSLSNKLAPSNSVDLTIPVPQVNSVSPGNPSPAARGSVVTVNGKFFGVPKGKVLLSPTPAGTVRPLSASVQTWSDQVITFAAPATALGTYSLRINNASGTSGPPASVLITVP